MMFADDDSFASRLVRGGAHQLHLSAGEGEAVADRRCFFPDLYVGKTLARNASNIAGET
jgi:hypothetical protein